MEVEQVLARTLSRGPPPAAFVGALQRALAPLPEKQDGVALRVAVTNSLAMASYAVRRGDRATITLDWAQIERTLIFFDSIESLLGSPEAPETLLKFLKAEILLCQSRKALSLGRYVHARECHRMREELQWSHIERPLDETRTALAVRFATFILHHEIAHQLCRNDPTRAKLAFDSFQARYRKLIAFTSLRGEELYCDRYAIEAQIDMYRADDAVGFVQGVCLLMLHLELWSVVSLMGHMGPQGTSGRLNSIETSVARELVADRVYRSEQAMQLLDPPEQSVAASAAMHAWRRTLAALQQAVEEALIDGISATSLTSWGEFDHIKRCLDDLMEGLTPDAEAAILESIAASD